jgi:DNA-binding XRE family transcriptional regulator
LAFSNRKLSAFKNMVLSKRHWRPMQRSGDVSSPSGILGCIRAGVGETQRAKKLSRRALAEKAGLHQTYVGMIESGLSNPSLDAANAIAETLQVPFSKLVAKAEALRRRAESAKR